MATFTVHARVEDLAGGDLSAAVAADRLKILPEGFSWGAALVPFLWAPWNRLWLVFLGWLAATVAIEVVDKFADPIVGGVLSAAFLIWFALSARDLQRWTLERKGWRLVGLVEARDPPEAEARFVEKLMARRALVPPPLPASRSTVTGSLTGDFA